jgi:hypothetical protein
LGCRLRDGEIGSYKGFATERNGVCRKLVMLVAVETWALGRRSSDRAGSVDEQDLARDVCAGRRSKQDRGAHEFLGLGDATFRSSGD